ncbi:MAG: hypothetical protein SNJ56_01590 [Termitinemataceae bacterium]
MKKMVVCLGLIVLLSLPAVAQVRIDMGFEIPRGIGAVVENQNIFPQEAVDFFNTYIIPLPEAGLYYQLPIGPVRIGAGLRVFTIILANIYWPNAFVEADLGNFTLAGQIGGGLFGVFGLFPADVKTGRVFIPDLSLWYRFGNSFRVGGGATGLLLPESDTLGYLYYIGAKFAVVFR